jgi:peptidoglycan hydrolase-like protein with peptidoglycan-binding domain
MEGIGQRAKLERGGDSGWSPLSVVLVVLLVAGVGAVGWWAGRTALVSPEDPLVGGLEPVTFVVDEGSVGRSLTFTAVAEWELVPVGRNSAAGVVTSVDVAPGDEVSAGGVLYSVDLRPVVAAVGAVPAFRDLTLRSEGPDVAQLQDLLGELGWYEGVVDGAFGSSTRTAVRAWQLSLGVNDDGVVRARDVVFVSVLPVRVAFSEALTVGARLGGGEEVVLVVPTDPVFRVPLSIEQRNLVPLSAEVAVTFPEGVWSGRVDRAVESPEFGQLDLIVTAGDGGSLCGDECARWVDLEQRTDFQVNIVVIPEASGPVVPIAALHTDAANQPFVVGVDGAEIPVTIVAASQGIAVVEGVEAGTVIMLPVGETGSG